MNIARALDQVDDGQADCYWHDKSYSLCYVLVLQGVVLHSTEAPETSGLAQLAGRITTPTQEFNYLSRYKPELMPGEVGAMTVLLVL